MSIVAFYTTGGGTSIRQNVIDMTTGALSSLANVSLGAINSSVSNSFRIVLTPDNRFAYVSASGVSVGGVSPSLVFLFSVDPATGALTSLSPGSVTASAQNTTHGFVVISAPAGTLFVGSSAQLIAIPYDAGTGLLGSPTISITFPTAIEFLVMNRAGTRLFAILQNGTYVAYSVGTGGVLAQTASGAFSGEQSGYPDKTALDATGSFLYSMDSTGAIFQYRVDSATGALTPLSPASVTAPLSKDPMNTAQSGFDGLVLCHPVGGHVYSCLNSQNFAQWDAAADGSLTFSAHITDQYGEPFAYITPDGSRAVIASGVSPAYLKGYSLNGAGVMTDTGLTLNPSGIPLYMAGFAPMGGPGAPGPPGGTGGTGSGGDCKGSGCYNALTWAASAGATSYDLQRGAASGGPYAPLVTGLTTTSYHDPMTTADNGVTFWYEVRAVNSSGASAWSAPFSVASTCPICGCTNPLADNFNRSATQDDGSCVFSFGDPFQVAPVVCRGWTGLSCGGTLWTPPPLFVPPPVILPAFAGGLDDTVIGDVNPPGLDDTTLGDINLPGLDDGTL